MKKIFCLLLVMVSSLAIAQKSITLKVAYIPDHQYNMDTKNLIKMVMDVQADDATKEQMKASGMALPMVIDMTQDMAVLMKTGKFNNKKEVPVTIEYTKFEIKQSMAGQEMPAQGNPLNGMKLTGWGESNGKLRLETVEGETVTEEVRKMMISTTDQLGTQVMFPDKPLKVGDEFTQEIPFNMPIQGGTELKMVIKTIYKLTSFDNNNAFFDTDITMTMDMTVEKGTMTAEGKGKGKMTFDIKKSYLSKYDSNIDMDMKMKMGPMDMDIKSSAESKMTVSHL